MYFSFTIAILSMALWSSKLVSIGPDQNSLPSPLVQKKPEQQKAANRKRPLVEDFVTGVALTTGALVVSGLTWSVISENFAPLKDKLVIKKHGLWEATDLGLLLIDILLIPSYLGLKYLVDKDIIPKSKSEIMPSCAAVAPGIVNALLYWKQDKVRAFWKNLKKDDKN